VNTPEAIFSLNGTPALAMNDGAAFAEATIHGVWGNLTAGQRVEHNDLAGDFTAPRLAYTLARGRFHGKLLWSKAFRIPTVMNMNYGPVDGSLIAEHVTTTEAELGTKLGSWGQLSFNLYETRIDDPIVHRYDSSAVGSYVNRTSSGTQGLDLRFSLDQEKWTVLTGFGMHRALTGSDIPERMLPPDTADGYQGLPSARAFAVLAWTASNHFTLRTRVQWQESLWSYQYQDRARTELVLMNWPSELLVNAGLTIRPNGKDHLAIDLGCNNILDQERLVLSPSANAFSPLRLNGREWTLSVIFKFMQ
jgi:outer membrane receptor for ferrienterochelin and colicin